ncbi:WLM-domain-containing protein [Irpex rosettiformis]|uniref:WLM-domain-containing protein n=1 Tax=Irpex rosettiformis TaxID=378272 RepID=A0ACB8UBZ2_9APHY|nr:WLM-domain-containing protein [Irpex rosettiformis]
MATIDFTVSHKGRNYSLSLPSVTTFEELQAELEELTSVAPKNQKVLYKGKKATLNVEGTIGDAGIKSGVKVQLLGSTAEELGELRQVEGEFQRRERILRERASKSQPKLRSTGSASSSSIQFRFHSIEPLPHLPNPSGARELLEKLSNDPAIRHVMQIHHFSVGLLTELAPHEHPELLGLNVNAGQAIKLRLRTDAYDGFRLYKDVRRVLCHELTHNVWGDHDNNFKELNSKLNREVLEFERSVTNGTHTLSGLPSDIYQPSSEQEAYAQSYILGGSAPVEGTIDERRQLMLQAAMKRLQKDEEDLENSCGTSGPSATQSSSSS